MHVLKLNEEIYYCEITSAVVMNYVMGPKLGVRRRMQNNL